MDADTLPRLPLDMERYRSVCTEELSDEVVQATKAGSQSAQRKDVAWVTAFNTISTDLSLQPWAKLPNISHDDLVRAQKEDQTINQIRELKVSNTKETEKTQKGVSEAA